jgi:hypothetical protein
MRRTFSVYGSAERAVNVSGAVSIQHSLPEIWSQRLGGRMLSTDS